MKKIKKGQLMAVLMSFVMILSLMPIRSFADNKQIISEANVLGVETPVIGQTPNTDAAVPDDAVYSLRDESKYDGNITKFVIWYDNTDNKQIYKNDIKNGYTFIEGHEYFAKVIFVLKDLSLYDWDKRDKIVAKMDGKTAAESGGKFRIHRVNINKEQGLCFVDYHFGPLKKDPGPKEYKISISSTTNGIVTSKFNTAPAGTVVELMVNSNKGYELDNLIVKDEETNPVAMETPTSFKMPAANVNVVATFKKRPVIKHTVKFKTNGGSTVQDQSVNNGEKATKPADPTKEGYDFEGWYSDEALSNPFDFDTAITKDTTLYAKWKAKKKPSYTVSMVNPIENGKVTVDKDSGLSEGDLVKITVTPDEGYELDNIIVKDEGTNLVAMETPTSFKMPAANVIVNATFKEIPVTYTIVSGANGEWFKDSGKDFEFVIKRNIADNKCFDHFRKVMIDGNVLTAGVDYDAKAGSTIIKIKAATLQKLGIGKHIVMVVFKDREIETALNINAALPVVNNDKKPNVKVVNANKTPNTADDSNVALWAILMLMSIGAAAVCRSKIKNYR